MGHLNEYKMVSHCGFGLLSLISNDIEYLFECLLGICIFFSKIKYYICGLRSAESVDIELWTWKIHCKIILKFWTSWGMAPLTHIVGVQTVYSTTLAIIGMYTKCFQDIG